MEKEKADLEAILTAGTWVPKFETSSHVDSQVYKAL